MHDHNRNAQHAVLADKRDGEQLIATASSWFLLGALLAPLTTLLHELSHFAAALAAGRPNVVFRAFEVTYDHFEQARIALTTGAIPMPPGYSMVGEGLIAASGPAVSIGLTLAACYAIHRSGAAPWLIATALVANSRALFHALQLVTNPFAPTTNGGEDELLLAAVTDIPLFVLRALNVAVFAWVVIFLIRRLERSDRTLALSSLAFGSFIGLALYASLLPL